MVKRGFSTKLAVLLPAGLSLPFVYKYFNKENKPVKKSATKEDKHEQQVNAVKQLLQSGNVLHSGVCMIPHIEKRDKGGEDAYVVTKDNAVIAVADGVGGWNKKGVDPALFSNELTRHFKSKYENMRQLSSKVVVESLEDTPKKQSDISLKELLVDSVKDTKSIGTSTFVAAMVHEQEPLLYGLNLGDSGYMIVRPKTASVDANNLPYDMVFRTEEQQYKFNHPYQCGTNYKLPYHAAEF